jgi:hypothetical protein
MNSRVIRLGDHYTGRERSRPHLSRSSEVGFDKGPLGVVAGGAGHVDGAAGQPQ